jgi:ferric-dicitrate binding protein FerR (iron transport regulator)
VTTTAEPDQRDWLEIVATVLLAVAAVATAWSSYQANRWNGETTKATGRVNALRVDAARSQGLAEAQTQVDVATFIQWVNATATDQPKLADFYAARFRPEFRPAFDAWQATDPFNSADAPPTPFAMEEYQLQARADVERIDAEAELAGARVRGNIQRSANYVLAVVLFAVALFFAGMSTKLSGAGPRRALLVVGCTVFVGTTVWIATFPISLSV